MKRQTLLRTLSLPSDKGPVTLAMYRCHGADVLEYTTPGGMDGTALLKFKEEHNDTIMEFKTSKS